MQFAFPNPIDMQEIKTLDSKIVYSNRWMSVREDKIQRRDGSEGIYGVVDKPDFVVILPIQHGHIHLVEQYRYPLQGRYWELPQGSWEQQPDSDPLDIARGELKEETGFIAQNMQYVGHQFLASGYSSQGYHVFVATELSMTRKELETEEQGLVSDSFSIQQFESMILDGTIKDATTVNAYGLAKLKGVILY